MEKEKKDSIKKMPEMKLSVYSNQKAYIFTIKIWGIIMSNKPLKNKGVEGDI